MKSVLILVFFGGVALFSTHTDLSPSPSTAVLAISEAAKINPQFIATVINTANPTGEIPDSYDLFGTGESYTSCASSICDFIRFIQKQGIDPEVLKTDPDQTLRILIQKGIIDSTILTTCDKNP